MSALLLLQFNPHKCPCCFDVQQYDGATRGPCHADCMPFSASYPGCPLMSYSGSACRSTALMSGASLSYTPKCAKDFGGSGTACVYKSPILTNAACNCSGQWAQYCIDDETGNRGRSWVVEFWCKDNNTLAVTNYNVVIQDWQCLCDGAAHGFADGAGARFAWSLGIGGCCCNDCSGPPDCTCTPPSTLYVDVTGCGGGWDVTGAVITYDSGSNSWITSAEPSASINAISLKCEGGTWKITIAPIPADCVTVIQGAASGTCSPLSLTFSVSLDSTCYPPSGCTLTVTVSE